MIVNLQKTPKDKKANLVIHAKCDEVMQQLMNRLDISLPSFTRQDAVCVSHAVKQAKLCHNDDHRFSCTIHVQSIHGPKCPLPLVQQVDFGFEVCTDHVPCFLLPACLSSFLQLHVLT